MGYLLTAYGFAAFCTFVMLLSYMTPDDANTWERVRLVPTAVTGGLLWPLAMLFGLVGTLAYIATRSAAEGLDD